MQCLTWFEPDEVALRAMLVRWVIAYPKAVMCHIRVDNDLATELKVSTCTICSSASHVLMVLDQNIREERLQGMYGRAQPVLCLGCSCVHVLNTLPRLMVHATAVHDTVWYKC